MQHTDPLAALEALRDAAFADLSPPPAALQRELSALLGLRRLTRGRPLINQGARCAALYAVLAGEIAIRFRGADGDESLLEHVRPVRLFGLSAFATGLPSRYEAAATEPTQLLVISPPAYALLMDGWPGFARGLLKELARRFDGSLHQLESARHRSAAERLRLALQQLRRERGETLPGGAWRVSASQSELAQLAGVTRQTANEWLRASSVVVGYRLLSGAGQDIPSSTRGSATTHLAATDPLR